MKYCSVIGESVGLAVSLPVTGAQRSRSRSHVTSDGQSASMSRFRADSGTCDQILLSVRRLSERCCLVSMGRPLWRDVGSVIYHSGSVAIYQYLHQAFTMYMQYIQSFFQSRLGTTDYVLLVNISSNYRSSLDTWKVVQMTAAKFKPFILSVWGFALSNSAYIFIFMIMNDFWLSSA
jgi:hypothetical protein